ncbi:MAG: VPLPA-CTERM sorting domain-containing protein [Roseobacter sp.]|jgi:hypothetical protein|nr:VPLPA-CTERM sorting domain-containing protein [Roseobacter sp.]
MKHYYGALALCAGLATTAEAATFFSVATTGNSGCSIFESNGTGSSATCAAPTSGQSQGNGAFASSEAGILRVGAESFGFRDAGGVLQVSPTQNSAQATFSDRLFFSEDSGTYRLEVDLLGSLSLFAPDLGPPSVTMSSISFDASANGQLYEFDASVQEGVGFGGPQLSVDRNEVVDFVDVFEFDFTGGQLDLFVSLQALSRCSGTIGTTCTGEAEFLNSLRITGGEVLDANGNLLSGGFLGSDSGFDYIAGVEPHERGDQVSPVPLPAGAWLMLAGLAGLGTIRATGNLAQTKKRI